MHPAYQEVLMPAGVLAQELIDRPFLDSDTRPD
jgi:hypothetical protein